MQSYCSLSACAILKAPSNVGRADRGRMLKGIVGYTDTYGVSHTVPDVETVFLGPETNQRKFLATFEEEQATTSRR